MKRSLLFITVLFLFSCKKETINQFEIDAVQVHQNKDKGNLKSDLQFVSIAYSDLFGTQISISELNVLLAGYNSMGDKSLIIDRIIRKMLSISGIKKPSDSEMKADPETFIKETFERFFIREPAEMETWFFKSLINENASLKAEDVYYALMSSTEYRYY